MKRPFLLLALAITGCATTAGYENILKSWVGKDEATLVREWGPPQQTYTTGGSKFLMFSRSRNVFIPGMMPSYQTTALGNTVYTNPVGGVPAHNVEHRCDTIFELKDNVIVSWQWRGNSCRAQE